MKAKARRFDVVDVRSQDMLRKIVGQSHQSVPIRTKERVKAVRKVENQKGGKDRSHSPNDPKKKGKPKRWQGRKRTERRETERSTCQCRRGVVC